MGILGGGQLAKMLCEAAIEKLHIVPLVYSDVQKCPAKFGGGEIIIGDGSEDSFRSFFGQCERVIFESEFIDTARLEAANQAALVPFFPKLSVMARFQDKLEQKKICAEHNVPTSRWLVIDKTDPERSLKEIQIHWDGKAVLKWARLGYDGKGNFFLTDCQVQKNAAIEFIQKGLENGGDVYAEEMISFQKEIAIIATRSVHGVIVTYPVVISEQSKGICLNVKGPADKFEVPPHAIAELEQVAKIIGEQGDIVGTYAVEAFLVRNEVLVNEIAPRVHNTGHYSQDAATVSQFENHLRAVLGLEVVSPETSSYFGMRNILGPVSITKDEVPVPTVTPPLRVHWYQKTGSRPGRKLGHINFHADTSREFEPLFSRAIAEEKSWVDSL